MTPREIEIRSKKAEDILNELRSSVRKISKEFVLLENLRRSFIIEENPDEKAEIENNSNETVAEFYKLCCQLGERLTSLSRTGITNETFNTIFTRMAE